MHLSILLISMDKLLFFWPLALFAGAVLYVILFRKRLKSKGNADSSSPSTWTYSDASPSYNESGPTESFGGYGGGDGGGGGASGDWGDSGGDNGGDSGGDSGGDGGGGGD